MLQNFKGDLHWIHSREGHAGKPYWPRGASGVTLDPGIDLGYTDAMTLRGQYSDLMTADQLAEAHQVLGVKGAMAERLLEGTKFLKHFRINRADAKGIFPLVARTYWEQTLVRWPELVDAPPCVQTAMLSLTYNRGPDNRRLTILSFSIASRNWNRVGELIYSMQQNHKLVGIRKRRRLEGALILKNLATEMKQGYKGMKKLSYAPIQNFFKSFFDKIRLRK